MHHFKNKFQKSTINSKDKTKPETFANIQKVLRTNDLDELENHHLIFHMIGLFSFNQMRINEAIYFILGFLKYIKIFENHKIKITIHPDKFDEWEDIYLNYFTQNNINISNIKIVKDKDCLWSCDGKNYDYCTEFHVFNDINKEEIEIGNIVYNNGCNIDVGLGLERIDSLINPHLNEKHNPINILIETIIQLNNENINIDGQSIHYKHGFILKKLIIKLINELIKNNDEIKTSKPMLQEIIKMEIYKKIFNNKKNILLMFLHNRKLDTKIYRTKDDQWWIITHSIPLEILRYFRNNEIKYKENAENILNFFDVGIDY